MPNQLNKIKQEIAKFEKLQTRYKHNGAGDTEPDGVFQVALARALDGERKIPPPTADAWQLYNGTHEGVDSNVAGTSLSGQTEKVVDLILSTKLADLPEVKTFLAQYCWRV